MMCVWSQRPHFLHLGLFTVAYFLGCGFAQALAIVPGISVSIWPPAGVFIATLVLTSPYSWPWWMLAGCLAEMFAQLVWFQSPLPAGFLIYVGNALCAAVGATLLNRLCGSPIRFETLREVLAFVVLGAGVAPLVSATVGSAALAWFGVRSQTFTAVWPLFWIGDATGILLVAPLALVVIQQWRSKTELSAAQRMEAGVLGLVFLGVAALSLSNYYLPFAYIIMPPLLWAAVRFEFKGVAVALTLLALITLALTISGGSQFVGDPESQREKQVMLQLFLVISALSALIVAAISRQYQLALLTLRQRERELSQLVDMVPSFIWRLTADGKPIFFNKRGIEYFGLDVGDADKPDKTRLEAITEALAHPDDAAELARALSRCVVTGESFSMRYRLRRADGVYRWMSGRAEPLRDESGSILQWYGLTHDIDDLVHAEEALRRAQDKLARASQAASLSELSASIAHEVNQPLAAIVATSHACGRWLSADPPNLERAKITLDRIIRDANSAGQVVSRIRALFSQMRKARSPADMTEVIAEVCGLMADELAAKNIQLETELDRSLPPALIDRIQMQQVLVNLIRNAIDALYTIVDGNREIRLRAVADGDNAIRVEVRDLGAGMKEPERAFDPFFTTKENGMGMGLAICRSIIEAHNGRLWAVSNEPRGMTLAFTLPVRARQAA
jgi:PAS domain S-box-containing protein